MDDDTPFEDRLRSALAAGIEAADDGAAPVSADRAALDRRVARHRRRTHVGRAAAVVLVVAGAAVGGWSLGRDDTGRDDVERVAGTTTTAAASTTAATPAEIRVSDEPLPVVGAGSVARSSAMAPYQPEGVGEATIGWIGPGPMPGSERPSAALFTRTLPDGTVLDVRGNRFDAVAYDIPPFWDPPGWCLPAGDVYVGVRLPEAVGQVTGVRYDDVRPGEVRGSVQIVGEPEGHPQWVVVAQGPAGTETVRVTFPGGGSDEVELTDGLAVLTAPRQGSDGTPDENGLLPGPELVALDADGEEVARGELVRSSFVGMDDGWTEPVNRPGTMVPGVVGGFSSAPPPAEGDCAEPTALPAPGAEQPADPAAAEAEIRATWDAAVGQPAGTPPADVYDDTTGLAEAQAELRESQTDELLDSVTIPIDAVVFADAEVAYIQYGVHVGTYDTTYYGRFAELVHVDGRWKVTRASVCRLLSLGGGTCEPIQER